MANLIIRGVRLMEYCGYCNNNGAMVYELKCRAAWSVPVCEQMGWQKEPNGFANVGLEGKLYGISMVVEPNSKNLKDYRFDININLVGGFKHIAKTENENVVHRELEFVVTTSAEEAPMVFSNYMAHCCPGDDRGQAKINFSEEEQMDLDEGGDGEWDGAEKKPRGRKKQEAEG